MPLVLSQLGHQLTRYVLAFNVLGLRLDRGDDLFVFATRQAMPFLFSNVLQDALPFLNRARTCLLYTSDAADE